MVFNATFNHISAISWLPILLVEETGVHEENYRPLRTEVGFIFPYALIVIHCSGCEFDSYTWWDVPDTFYMIKQS
jgi:hypothetical protein